MLFLGHALRRAVFDCVIMMSPSFFDRITYRRGAEPHHNRYDLNPIGLRLIDFSHFAQFADLYRGLALMFLTSVKLTGLVLLIVSAVIIPILTLGRRLYRFSKLNQDWIAVSSGTASESLSAVQTVQAFTHEAQTQANFVDVTEKAIWLPFKG